MSVGVDDVVTNLEIKRSDLYAALASQTGNTPFREVPIPLDKGCTLWAKEEYRNPTGSHYDREMWRFLQSLEMARSITPGKTKMLETTTGNSGASFAWMCRVLGYPAPTIIIPADMPPARLAQLRSYGANLILSPRGEYITGIGETYEEVAPRLCAEEDFFIPQHWNDQFHCVAGMTELGNELIKNAARESVEFDCFMLALGNGGSARGVGQVLKDAGVKLIGVEPKESPIIDEYRELRPEGRWESRREHTAHGILGTGPFRPAEIYTNMRYVVNHELLDGILHPSSDDALQVQQELMDRCGQHVGMSSAACVWAVREYIKQKNPKRALTFGAIFYDPSWKYL